MVARAKAKATLRLRFLSLLLVLVFLPIPSPSASAFNAGQAVTQFYQCTDVNWQNCASGNFSDQIDITKTGQTSNEESSRYGFRFPARGVAQSGDFDVQTEHGYKQREIVENSAGQWNQPGVNSSNVTSLFGLRLDLDGSPPVGPNGASPFFPPSATNPNVTFNTGLNNYDVAAGDFDSDGDDDLAVLAGTNSIQIRRLINGTWSNFTSYAIPAGFGTPFEIKSADMNGDGRMDAAILTRANPASYLFVLVQLPWGGMRLEGPLTVITGGSYNAQDFAVGDLTGDGRPDVAVVYSNRTVYWLNQGGSTNLDFWSANTYSIKLQSLLYGNAPSFVVPAPSPCNATVAAGNLDGSTYLYWQSNFTQITRLIGHASSVQAVAWSPNCQYLATASSDKTVLIWRTSNWALAANLTNHTNSVYSVAFSPDSSRLASGGADSTVLVWNVTSFPPTIDYNISENNGTIYALAFSPNGSYLAAGTGNNTVRIHTTSDFSTLFNLISHTLPVRTLAFAPNGTELASGSLDDTAILWNTDAMTKTGQLSDATADINAISYAPNGTRLLTGSSDGHLRLYLTSNWSVLDDVVEGSSFVYGSSFDRSGEFLISGGTTNYLRLWDRSTLVSTLRTYTGQEYSATAVAYSSDGRFAMGAEDGTVSIVTLSNGSVAKLFRAHDGTLNRLAWSPNAALLATGGSDGLIHVFDTSTWGYAANITLGGNVTGLDFNAAGTVLAATNGTGGLAAWNVPGYTSINAMTSVAATNSMALDPSGTMAALAGADGIIRVFNITQKWNFQNLSASGVQKAVDWSPDGAMIASGGVDRRARSWWTSNWTLNSNVLQHSNDITSLAFSPDSLKYATGGWDARIFVYNRTGAVVQQYPSAPAGSTLVLAVAWSPDGRSLAAGWHSVRFPQTKVNACPNSPCGLSINAYGIAIGNVDNTAGNEVVITGSFNNFGGSDSAVWKLPFSGGNPGSFTDMVPKGLDPLRDAFRIALGDLNGDGRNDIAVGTLTPSSGSLYLIAYNSTGNNWDTANIAIVPIGGAVNEIEIADVTDDGHNDVVIAAGAGTFQLQVAYWEPTSRVTGTLQISNVSKFLTAATGSAPTGLAIGRFNNDSLLDVAISNGIAATVTIYLQKDRVYGLFISQRLQDQVFIGDPIVAAWLYWSDWNVIPGVTGYNISITVNNGFTWIPVQQNVSINLNGTNSSTIYYRIDFWADHAGVTPWILSVAVDYVVETTPQDLSMDILRDFQPPQGECYWPGQALGLFHCSFPASILNQYVLDNWNLQDGNGTIYMPIRIRWQRPATVHLTNLSIPFNKWPSPPEIVAPLQGTFVDATPTFVMRAADTDSDNLRYHVQIAYDPAFVTIVREFNQNDTALGWGLPFYVAGADATLTTPDAFRMNNGQQYCWRAEAFDGLQWSDWSVAQCFTVDDLAPDGFASSPAYSTTETFTISWSSVDPAGGAGLAAAPYDVQFKDGVEGTWTDLVTTTALSSTNFVGQNGHTYCFRMRSVDAAGNAQLFSVGVTGDTCTIIDTDKPTATVNSLAPYQVSRNFEVAWGGADGVGGSGVGGFDVSVLPEGGSWTNWLTGYASTSAVYSAPDDRLYTFRVAARDRAGNLGGVSDTAATKVDTTPPVCQVAVSASTITSLEQVGVSMACNDAQTGLAAYEYCVGEGPSVCDQLLPVRTASPVLLITDLSLLNGGTYYVSVHGLNNAGGWSAWVSSGAVRVVIPGPAAHIEYTGGVWTQTNLTVNFGASDALGYAVVAGELQYRRAAFRYNQLAEWQDWLTVVVDPADSSYFFDSGAIVRGYAYEFRFRARNEVGSWGDHATGETVYVNQLPVASAGADRLANLSEHLVLNADATIDYDGARDTLDYKWETDDGRQHCEAKTCEVFFTTPGTHRVTLTVSDGHENATATVMIEVLPDPPRQVAPGLEGPVILVALFAVALVATYRRRRRD